MTEDEYMERGREFIGQLPHYPQVGKRPFGYPKKHLYLSGFFGFFGMVLALPLVFLESFERWHVLAALAGAVLFCCGFTMRVVAFALGHCGAVDRWIILQLKNLPQDDSDTVKDF